MIQHVHHAGNSSGVVDGAAAVLMASPDYAKAHGLKARARIVATANMGDDPTLMLNAPVPAARKVLARAGLTIDDIDLFEVNEAFAVVAEKFQRDLDLDRDKVNVNGGAMALGHPIGATGAILIGTVLDELERRDGQFGLITMCAGGGMAPAIIIERTLRPLLQARTGDSRHLERIPIVSERHLDGPPEIRQDGVRPERVTFRRGMEQVGGEHAAIAEAHVRRRHVEQHHPITTGGDRLDGAADR